MQAPQLRLMANSQTAGVRNSAGVTTDSRAATGGLKTLSMGEGTLPPSRTPISARLGGGEALWPTLLAASWGPWRLISVAARSFADRSGGGGALDPGWCGPDPVCQVPKGGQHPTG